MTIDIRPLQPHQIEAVKQIITIVVDEIWQISEAEARQYDDLADVDGARSHYFDNNGTFLVVLNDETTIGCGAIRRLNHETCELKRMWLLKEYRGQGIGFKLIQELLNFARSAGYRVIRLDVFDPGKQQAALEFYKRHGFYPIERYNDSLSGAFLEKKL